MTHFGEAVLGRGVNVAKDEWLYDLLLNAYEPPILDVLEFVADEDVHRAERAWIERRRAAGHPLLNGDSTAWAKTTAGREKLRSVNTGRKLSDATREKMRAARLAYLERSRNGVDR
jgi:hypothetical protein